jgi:hypothetical protein
VCARRCVRLREPPGLEATNGSNSRVAFARRPRKTLSRSCPECKCACGLMGAHYVHYDVRRAMKFCGLLRDGGRRDSRADDDED